MGLNFITYILVIDVSEDVCFIPAHSFYSMQRGRPKVTISSSELLQLWKGGHTKKYIADHFGISRQTLERVLVDDGIKVFETSGLTDEELDELTIEFKCIMPAAGERLVLGHFRANG